MDSPVAPLDPALGVTANSFTSLSSIDQADSVKSFDAEFGIPPIDKLPTLESILNDDDLGSLGAFDKLSLAKDDSRSQTSLENNLASEKHSLVQSDSNSLSEGLNTSSATRLKSSNQSLAIPGATAKDNDSVDLLTRPFAKGIEDRAADQKDFSLTGSFNFSNSAVISEASRSANDGSTRQSDNSAGSHSLQQPLPNLSASRLQVAASNLSVVSVKAAKRSSVAITAHLIKLEEQSSLRSQIISAVDRVDAGLPSAIAAALSGLVAVGTSHGVVLVFDVAQVLRFCVGNRNVGREYGGVSCLSFNRDSTRLLVGYAKGQMTMWDMTNGKLLRNMVEAHQEGTAVLHVRFTDDPTLAICSDSGGSVYALHFKRLIGRSCETVCLFSGSRGEVCAVEPLNLAPTFKDHPLANLCMLAMASFSKIFVVTLYPEMKVRFVHPLRGEAGTLPLLSWRLQVVPASSVASNNESDTPSTERVIQPLLAFARDRHLHLVHVHYKSDDQIRFIKHKTLDCGFQLIAFRFINHRVLVAVDIHERLHVVDYQCEEALANVSLDVVQLAYATSHFKAIATGSNVSRALALAAERACYHSVTVEPRDSRILLLGMQTVYSVVLQSWDQRVDLLVKENRFREALELCKACLDGTAKAVIGLSGVRRREIVSNKLLNVLIDFVDAVMKRLCPERGNYAALRAHFESVVPVIVEFALLLGSSEVLFDIIFKKLRSDPIAHEIFLESLDRHVAEDRLTYVPTYVVNELLAHYQTTRRTDKMETVLTHLDCSELDIQQLLLICRQFSLDDALIHLYNKALTDYVTPLRELLDGLSSALRQVRNDARRLSDETIRRGNRILVYLSCSLCGRAYPVGDIPQALVSVVREQIYDLLTIIRLPPQRVGAPFMATARGAAARHSSPSLAESDMLSAPASPTEEVPTGEYPYVCTLLHFDVRDFLNVLSLVFDDSQLGAVRRQRLMDVLLHLMTETVDFSPDQIGVLFVFTARQLARHHRSITIPKALLDQIVEYLCTVDAPVFERRISFDAPHSNLLTSQLDDDTGSALETGRPRALSLAQNLERQQVLIELLAADCPVKFDERWLLTLAERARFYRVSELIYERQRRFDKVLACYLLDTSKRDTVFIYAENVLVGEQYSEREKASLRIELLSNAQQLLSIDADRFVQLTITFTPLQKMLNLLDGNTEGTYRFLKAFFKLREAAASQQQPLGVSLHSQPPMGAALHPNVAVNVSPEIYESFIGFLCQFEQESTVLRHLQLYETPPFRTQQAISICERSGYLECVAFLYESIEDVSRAAQVHRTNLDGRLREAAAALRGTDASQKTDASSTMTSDAPTALQKKNEIAPVVDEASYNRLLERVRPLVVSIIQFCQRVSRRLDDKSRQSTWFALFDSVKLAYADVRTGISEPTGDSDRQLLQGTGDQRTKWITCYASELRALTSDVLNIMVTHVSLPVVLHKLIQDPLYSVNRFGEIRDMILGMLDTYNYERTLLDACSSMMTRDLLRQIRRMQSVARSSFPIRKLRCSLCRGPLADEQDAADCELVLFKCGHLYHRECLRSFFVSQSGANSQQAALSASTSQHFVEDDSNFSYDEAPRCPFCIALGRSRTYSRSTSTGVTTPRTISMTGDGDEENRSESIVLPRATRLQPNAASQKVVRPSKAANAPIRVDPAKYAAFRRAIDTSNSFGDDKLLFLNELSRLQKDRNRSGSGRNPFST